MRIQHNITALNAYRQLGNNNNSVSKNLEKLSSGYRINRAGDDAAGLAISEKMRAQITGLETAQKNANDGISLVQTAEGALTEVHSMLNRMVELADQSANGTYQDAVDRENLQKEVNSLTSEIDRISDSTNFNGINLLDGSVNKTAAVTAGAVTPTTVNETKTAALGTFGTSVDGKLDKKVDAQDYSSKFYVGDITNSDATAAKDLVFKYNDNKGVAKSVTLSVAAGTSLTTDDIAKALSGGTVSGVTMADDGVALDGAGGTGGTFAELYDVSTDGNIVGIKAKADKTVPSGTDVIDGNSLGGVSVDATGFNGTDLTAAEAKLAEKYDGTTTNQIGFGSAAGDATSYTPAVDGKYQVASTQLTLDAASTGANSHNKALTVGSMTYVIQNGTEDLKGLEGKVEGTDYKVVKVDSTDDKDAIASKLAAAISADEANNGGYVASSATGVVTISESTNKGQDVLNGTNGAKAGTGSKIASSVSLTTKAGTTTGTGTLATFNADKMVTGTSVIANGKTYTFVNSESDAVEKGATKILFSSSDSSEDLAAKLADALTKDGATGVSADGAAVKLTDSNINASAVAEGKGLTLQIGDTADSFNRISVKIGSTSASSLGINGIDIGTASGASSAIEVIKSAINSVSSTRGDLGAIQNRLEHTINNLSVTGENMTAAESRIRDVDMAEEMMNYTKNNILVQASQSMLAQANQTPQGVLQLLK